MRCGALGRCRFFFTERHGLPQVFGKLAAAPPTPPAAPAHTGGVATGKAPKADIEECLEIEPCFGIHQVEPQVDTQQRMNSMRSASLSAAEAGGIPVVPGGSLIAELGRADAQCALELARASRSRELSRSSGSLHAGASGPVPVGLHLTDHGPQTDNVKPEVQVSRTSGVTTSISPACFFQQHTNARLCFSHVRQPLVYLAWRDVINLVVATL